MSLHFINYHHLLNPNIFLSSLSGFFMEILHRRSTCFTGFTTSSINSEDELPDLRSATGSGSPAAGGHCDRKMHPDDTLQINNHSAGYDVSSFNFWHIHKYRYIDIYNIYIYTIYIQYIYIYTQYIQYMYIYIYTYTQMYM